MHYNTTVHGKYIPECFDECQEYIFIQSFSIAECSPARIKRRNGCVPGIAGKIAGGNRSVDTCSLHVCLGILAHICLMRFVSTSLLQVEKDSFSWHEKEVNLKVELADIAQRVSLFSESRIAELEQILQKLANERVLLETKFEEATREPSILSSGSSLLQNTL